MTSIRLLYVTTPDFLQAESLGMILLNDKLAACVNIIPGMTSLYWWEGKIEKNSEAVLIIKTTADRVDEVLAAVKKNHPYQVPCAISFAIEKGNQKYVDWLISSVMPS